MDAEVSAELRQRVKNPTDLPKFERLYHLVDRRLRKRGGEPDVATTSAVMMQAWREVFGVEWPETKAPLRRGAGKVR